MPSKAAVRSRFRGRVHPHVAQGEELVPNVERRLYTIQCGSSQDIGSLLPG